MKNFKLSFKILKSRMIIFALVLITFFVPQMSQNENSVDIRVLITALGIDKKEDEYEVSVQVYIPSKTSTEKDIISAKDKSVALATEQVLIKTGRLGIQSTCGMIVLGKDLVEKENVMTTLDYIIRNNIVPWSTVLVAGDKDAAQTLVALNKLEKRSPIGWSNYLSISEREFDKAAVTLRDFVKGVYGLTGVSHCSAIGTEEIPPEDQSGGGGSGGGGSSGGGSGGGGESKSESQGSFNPIKIDNSIFTQSSGGEGGGSTDEKKGQAPQLKLLPITPVFMHGKKIMELNQDQTEGYNWVDKKSIFHTIMVEDVGGYYFKDGKVSLGVVKKKVKLKSNFDAHPIISVNIFTNLVLEEVMQSDIPLINGRDDSIERSNMLSKKTCEYIEKKVRDVFDAGKEKDADVLNLVSFFYKFHNKQYKNYLSTGRTVTDLLKDIELKFDLKCEVEV